LLNAASQAPANKGRTFRAEVLSRAEAAALTGACSAASRTEIRDRALLTVLCRGGLRISRPSRCDQ
jgi:site-specific recombinase XerD